MPPLYVAGGRSAGPGIAAMSGCLRSFVFGSEAIFAD
jgi:hypothetical protein